MKLALFIASLFAFVSAVGATVQGFIIPALLCAIAGSLLFVFAFRPTPFANSNVTTNPITQSAPLSIRLSLEEDGRWIAEIRELPGALAYGGSRAEAAQRARVLALRMLADRLERGEAIPAGERLFANIS